MTTPRGGSPLNELRSRLVDLMPADQRALRRRIDGARRIRDPRVAAAAADEIATAVEAAARRVADRRARVPAITYPAELPVTQRRDDLAAAIRDHQVVIVAGETGSGKTTQLPKICLELGQGVRGMIGHTQPRRLAARTVAARIAEELGTDLGGIVGYQIRFTARTSEDTLVKVMTDGILLNELARDKLLSHYDTIIIDEAHERSLNIDFILGYLKEILPRRPDLKVIITSATIDPERFSRHFDGAPIVEVSGRTYPVEVRYRPIEDPDTDQTDAICAAVAELRAEAPGDILVFLSGEREIRDTADALGRLKLVGTEILPLYARLSAAEQHRVFAPHAGRRIVLATNVAETSLTVPGIRYVIDPGTARISRYSRRLKVQRLPIEPISQASANQRKGRCGRLSDGICVRLYSDTDFAGRPEFTDPEILRTNLASVILAMAALGLGDVAAFGFIDPPDRRAIADGVALLYELGALDTAAADPGHRLTPLGRQLARLPVDPRMARMLIEADRLGCADEVLVIASALSIQDPRERPTDNQQAADAKHARFAVPGSDFLGYLALWDHLTRSQRELSSNGFRRLCRTEYLNYLRVREWQDLHGQLRQIMREIRGGGASGAASGGAPGKGADGVPAVEGAAPGLSVPAEHVHQALLAGLLSHIGMRDEAKRDYLGARGARFAIFPGSGLFRKPPSWVMVAELVETSRLWGRVAARIEPEWIEALAGHLVKRDYSEPHWERKRAAVMASEKVTLYGVPIVASRRVNFGRIDPGLSREMFIRNALVEGDWDTRHEFFHANRRLLEEVEDLENRARRRDILVDDQALFDFYAARIPDGVVSGRHFDSWWKAERRTRPDLLDFSTAMLVNQDAADVEAAAYPDVWPAGGGALRLTYQFEPGAAADGVTVHIPLPLLNQVDAAGFDAQVPGLREELVTAMIRSLPKALRRNFVPVPDYARAVLEAITPGREPLAEAVAHELLRLTGVPVRAADFDLTRVPDHLKLTFQVEDESGRPLAEGKDLDALRRGLAARSQQAVAAAVDAAAPGVTRQGLRAWTIGTLPRTVTQRHAGYTVAGWPALVDKGDSVAVEVFDDQQRADAAMWAGTRRLLLLGVPSPIPFLDRHLGSATKLSLAGGPRGRLTDLLADCAGAAVDAIMLENGGPVWDEAGFGRLLAAVRAELNRTVLTVAGEVAGILTTARAVRSRLDALSAPVLAASVADMNRQLDGLVYPGFVTTTGWQRLPDLRRYLDGMLRRLDRLADNPARDAERTAAIATVLREYQDLVAGLPDGAAGTPELAEIRWMIEELRVSYFAQPMRTAYPVSDKRVYRAMDALELAR